MVTIRGFLLFFYLICSVLAKIHMVTKHGVFIDDSSSGSVLAKIHMVTKRISNAISKNKRSVLAKIHMVTKPQKYGSTFLNVIEY